MAAVPSDSPAAEPCRSFRRFMISRVSAGRGCDANEDGSDRRSVDRCPASAPDRRVWQRAPSTSSRQWPLRRGSARHGFERLGGAPIHICVSLRPGGSLDFRQVRRRRIGITRSTAPGQHVSPPQVCPGGAGPTRWSPGAARARVRAARRGALRGSGPRTPRRHPHSRPLLKARHGRARGRSPRRRTPPAERALQQCSRLPHEPWPTGTRTSRERSPVRRTPAAR